MSKINKLIIRASEIIGIVYIGISLALLFEYGFCLFIICLVGGILLIAMSKLIAHQKLYEQEEECQNNI